MIHVQTWTSGSFRITDMADAHKRGKVCQVLDFRGWMPGTWDEAHNAIRNFTWNMVHRADSFDRSRSFDDAVIEIENEVISARAAGIPEHGARVERRSIRSVDAPREKLTAGVAGKWSGSVDEDGVSLADLTDHYNDPRMITPSHRQKPSQAYRLAAKVWDRVKLARSMSEAGDILSTAGVKLHRYCAMD